MALYTTDALVLRVRNLGDADKVVTLLTLEQGKVQAVARGARRPRNRLAAVTQIFTHCQLQLFSGQSLHTVSQGEIKGSFRTLRDDLLRLAYATFACELLDEMVKERQSNEAAFYLLLATLHLLGSDDNLETVIHAFELRLLALLGYRPHLDSCVGCSGKVEGTAVTFAPAQGGVVCGACASGEGPLMHISRGALESMRRLLNSDLRRLGVLRLSAEMAAQVRRCLEEYINWRLDKRLKSLEFLHAVMDPGRASASADAND